MTRVGTCTFIAVGASLLLGTTASAQWLKLQNQTSTRLVVNPAYVVADNLEKDFGIGDFDNDGDPDLVMMRKFAGSQTGGWANILFMNEGGILVDRTAEYASSSDVVGYNGFFDLTNDRDVKVIDVNGDGWLDMVTCTTMSDGVIDILGQPRCYINLGNDGSGNWLGFQHQRNRIPHIFPKNNHATANPRFCEVGAGDLNGDGFPDLFFSDYDTAETVGLTTCIDLNGDGDKTDPGECQTSPTESGTGIYADFDGKLLYNWGSSGGPGPGYFYDTVNTIMPTGHLAMAFGNTASIADMNGDGQNDVIRINTLTSSQNVGIIRKNATGTGFAAPVAAVSSAPYFHETADLNGDGKLDIVVADDAKDRYLINTGNNAAGHPQFTSYTLAASPTQFDHTIRIADMDNDGKPDVFIADVDADLGPFCPTANRKAHIYRNVFSGGNVGTLLDMVQGDLAMSLADRDAWFDVAPMDIDGDGWLDLVVGRCGGMFVYMNRNAGINFSYPIGRPNFIAADTVATFPVSFSPQGVGTLLGGSAKLNYRLTSSDGDFTQVALTSTGGSNFNVDLPATACGQEIEWYIEGSLSNGGPYTDPAAAPALNYVTPVGSASVLALDTNFEGGTNEGWTVVNQNIAGGAKGWEVAIPVGTTVGNPVQPAAPGTAGNGTRAFVTWNGTAGGAVITTDLDGGPTTATSPVFDLSELQSATVSYSRWFFCDDALNPLQADALKVEVSNNGGASWVLVENVDWQANAWIRSAFSVNDFVTPTANMQLRFVVSDFPDNSITEAGFDFVQVTGVTCIAVNPCPADLNGSGTVDGADLAIILGSWGACGGCPADINTSGTVDGADLAIVLGAWGACK